MIQWVFVFGVVIPTLITVACFVGFLVCWFRFRSLKRRHVTGRKSIVAASCPRRCRVYVASSSTADAGTCGHRTACCFLPPATGSSIPADWATHVVDRRRNSVLLPLATDVVDTDVSSTATAEVRRVGSSVKCPDVRSHNFRPISGLRTSTTLTGPLSIQQDRCKATVSGALAQTRTMYRLSSAGEMQPEFCISSSEVRKKVRRPSSRALAVDTCYVEVEPIVHAAECPTTSGRRTRISLSKSIDDAVSMTTTKPPTMTSGLYGGDRKWHWSSGDGNRMSRTYEAPRLLHARRHHSLGDVPRHHRGELQIKTADQTSLDF